MRPSELFTQITKQTGLYNIQAIDNISSIMQVGLLSNEKSRRIYHISIAMEEVQQRRDVVRIPNGLGLHQYVNVYFDPHNPMLSARRSENENICILKLNKVILDFDGVVISDRNASSDYASFFQPEVGLQHIDFDLVYAPYWTDENYYAYLRKKSIKCAEVLIPYKIPYDYVMCAAVVNEKTQRRLEEIGFNRTTEIVPDLFF